MSPKLEFKDYADRYTETSFAAWEFWIDCQMVAERIACPRLDYPPSEAQYGSIEEWEKATGKDFVDSIASMY